MLRSKMIHDPRRKYPNKMGLTVGLTFHTPKFWDCKKHDFYASQFDDVHRELTDEEKEHRYQQKLAHAHCKRKHLAYKGYVYWTGPKRRYEFRYMGRLWKTQSRWPLSVSAHGRYVRWFDNGPKPEPKPVVHTKAIDDLFAAHNEQFKQAMDRSRAQMLEYEKKRSQMRGK